MTTPATEFRTLRTILIIDDDRLFLDSLTDYVKSNYPLLEIITYADPVRGLAAINEDLDLLLLDLEMPGIDGMKLLNYATQKGVPKSRIIILSGRDAEDLHQLFPMGICLAVLNKNEARQQEVLDMVFSALHEKCTPPC
jgi:DNA-binding NarL/FixJ family response regulator